MPVWPVVYLEFCVGGGAKQRLRNSRAGGQSYHGILISTSRERGQMLPLPLTYMYILAIIESPRESHWRKLFQISQVSVREGKIIIPQSIHRLHRAIIPLGLKLIKLPPLQVHAQNLVPGQV